MKREFNKFKLIATVFAIAVASIFSACKYSDEPADEPTMPSEDPDELVVEPLSPDLRPTLVNGRKWIYRTLSGPVKESSYTVIRDTIAEGYHAKVVKIGNNYGKVLIREDGGAIYHGIGFDGFKGVFFESPDPELPTEPKWHYTMGFNLRLGDVFGVKDTDGCWVEAYQVVAVGTMVLQGKTRRARKLFYHLSPIHNEPYIDYWVEGIGSLRNRFLSYYTGPLWPTHHVEYMPLIECRDGDEKIYDYREYKPSLFKAIDSIPRSAYQFGPDAEGWGWSSLDEIINNDGFIPLPLE